MGSLPKEDEPMTPVTMAINALKVCMYVMMTHFRLYFLLVI